MFRIQMVCCPETSIGEQQFLSVGYGGIFRIERREENLGTYYIVWYDGFDENGNLLSSLNALYVECVRYFQEEKK